MRTVGLVRPTAALALWISVGFTNVQAADSEDAAFFESKIRPILVAKCLECHGDAAKIKGGLRLTSRDAILKGGDSGPAAVAGKPEESLIVEVLKYVDEPRMPPKGKLADSDQAAIARWVKLGLPWPASGAKTATTAAPTKPAFRITPEHRAYWAFQPLKPVEPPALKHPETAPTTIDRFLQAAIERKGIPLSSDADRLTLLRRVTYDLTGLPPTPEEVKTFLDDHGSDAFEKVVERLLASPSYGEKWGRHWLDLARYADSRDSRGVGSDSDILESWHYRDYVVRAFNRDLPYDRFVREQLAGDLLQPNDPEKVDLDAMVATGFLTIGEWGTGDADKEKMMTDIVADQIDVTGRTFLGLTLGCARCHDHKFDPISTEDYYGLAGIFFSTHILPDPGAKTNGSPMLRTPLASRAQIARAEEYKRKSAELEARRARLSDEIGLRYARSQLAEAPAYLRAVLAKASDPRATLPAELNPGMVRRFEAMLGLGTDGSPLLRPMDPVHDTPGVRAWVGAEDTPSLSVNISDKPARILTFTLPPRSLNVHPSPNRPVALLWTAPVSEVVTISGGAADGDAACGDGVAWRVEVRRLGAWTALAEGEFGNGGKQEFDAGPSKSRLVDVKVDKGDAIRLAIAPRAGHACDTTTIRLKLVGKTESWDASAELVPDLLMNGKGNPHPDGKGRPGVWTAVELKDDLPSLSPEIFPSLTALRSRLKTENGADTAAFDAVRREFVSEKAEPIIARLFGAGGSLRLGPAEIPEDVRRPLASLENELAKLRSAPPPPIMLGLIAQEGGVPKSAHEGFHDARIHIRGEYQRLGKVVPRRFPEVLSDGRVPTIPANASGRVQLADWLARKDNVLLARVMVNRIWQFHFGEGLVRTPSNFGKLGEPPTHPELLDYLADRFIRSGWSIKSMHRLMLKTAAYRRSSGALPEQLKLDPDNKLLSRMNRRRLTSEEIRDTLLAAAGRLDLKGGGPADRDFNTPRRTIYQITIRSDRSSFGPLFDAADSTALIDKRTVSTVAPQALFLLNHPFVLTQAEALGGRVRREESGVDARLDRMYRLVHGRSPSREEAEIARDLMAAEGGADAPAAWTALAQVLLCSNEVIFVD